MISSARQRVNGPGELVQAVPYLLGFHPAASLVLVGLAEGMLVVTARVDLADADVACVAHTVAAMRDGGTEQIVAVLYPAAGEDGWRAVAGFVPGLVAAHGCTVVDVLQVHDGRWRSLGCDAAGCCSPGGQPVPQEPSAFATAATVAGVVALEDRAAVDRQLAPLPDVRRAELAPLIDAAENEQHGAVLHGHGRSWCRSVKRAIFAAARAADHPANEGVDDATAARFAAALADTAVRDAVWMAVDDGRLDGRRLWRDLARRVPAPYDAPPLFLFGWATWRDGDGALAGMAAQRAVDSDPTYSAADLLLAALTRGVDPRRLPRLRLPRSA